MIHIEEKNPNKKLPSNFRVIFKSIISIAIYMYSREKDWEILGTIILCINVADIILLITLHLLRRHVNKHKG